MSFTLTSAVQINHDKSDRELHKQNEEQHQGNSEAMEIDLKCAEKVTDSDVESNADDKVGTVVGLKKGTTSQRPLLRQK